MYLNQRNMQNINPNDNNILELRAAIAELDAMYPPGRPLDGPPVRQAAAPARAPAVPVRVQPVIINAVAAAAVAHVAGHDANGNDA